MPFVPIPDTCKVELVYQDTTLAGPVVNVMHARCAASPTPTQLTAIATQFQTFGDYLISNLFCGSTTFESVTVTDLNTVTGPQVQLFPGTTGSGGSTTAGGASALLKLTTGTRGRSYRGRVFIGPLNGADITHNAIGAGTISTIDTALAALQADLNGLSPASELVIASRVLGLATPVTGFGTESTPAYQRRRAGR